jgi:hypothetical protein
LNNLKALIFDTYLKKIECLNDATHLSIKNYFIFNLEAQFAVFISESFNESANAILKDGVVLLGSYDQIEKSYEVSGVFDLHYYSTTEDTFDEVTTEKINENLLHVFNGGTVDTVPNPMPYIKHFPYKEQMFVSEAAVNFTELLSREQVEAIPEPQE